MRYSLFVLLLVALVGCGRREDTGPATAEQAASADRQTILLFVKIPDPVMPLERGEKYEDPLNEFLVAKGLGEVTGGGSMLSETNAAGQRSIEWVGVDVDVYDPEKALPLLIEKLKELGVPAGTEIEQTEPVERTIKVE